MTVSDPTIAAMRFGLGLGPAVAVEREPEAMLAGLEATARARPVIDRAESARLQAELDEFRDARRGVQKMKSGKAPAMAGAMMAENGKPVAFNQERRSLHQRVERGFGLGMARAAASPHAFAERMARFWTNHFAVAVKFRAHAVPVVAYEDEAIRPHLAGRFSDMAQAVARHPAMLIYLDQNRSAGPNARAAEREGLGLNENLAREILELHTLGVGGPYAQADVIALALLLTGFAVRGKTMDWVYRKAWAEPGTFQLLGEPYRGASEDETLRALEALSVHPATARHLSEKLARHFVSETPPEALVSALETTWLRTGGDLVEVSRALLTHPAAWGPLGGQVRPPQEAVIAALRAAGCGPQDVGAKQRFDLKLTVRACEDMGQGYDGPPAPNGWPDAPEAWITPGAMAKRLDWATRMGLTLSEMQLDPRDFARAALGEALSEETAWAVAAASQRREGFALLLVSPDFNRR